MFHTTSFSRSGHLPDASHYRYSCSTSYFCSTDSSGRPAGGDERLDRLLQDMASLDLSRKVHQQHQHHRRQAFPLPYQTTASRIPRTSDGPKIEILDDDYEEEDGDHFQYSRSGAYPATRQTQRLTASSHVSAATKTTASSPNRPRTERRAITYPLPYSPPLLAPSAAASTSASASTTRPKKAKSNTSYAPPPPLPYQSSTTSKFGAEEYNNPFSKTTAARTANQNRRVNTDPDPDLISPSDSISQISVSVHSSSKNKKSSSSSGRGGTTLYTYVPSEERRGRTRRRGERWSESALSAGREEAEEGGGGGGMYAYSGGHGSVAGGYSKPMAATMMQMPKGKFETRVVTPFD